MLAAAPRGPQSRNPLPSRRPPRPRRFGRSRPQHPRRSTPPPQHVPLAATPRALAGPLLGTALARQDSLAPLFANLRGLAEGSVSLVLPKPLLAAIDRVLAQAVPAERRPVTAQVLREAVQGSGLFLEARQANGQARAARAAT